MIQIKPGVRLHGIRPEIVLALIVAADLWRETFNGEDLMVIGRDESPEGSMVITSGIEGRHMRKSKHYSGNAVDLRAPNRDHALMANLVTSLRGRLGDDYDVVAEGSHCHIEFDPKEPY